MISIESVLNNNYDMGIKETRRDNLRAISEELGGDAKLLRRLNERNAGGKSDRTAQQLSQWIGDNPTRGIGHKSARAFEEALDKPSGWLDLPHAESQEETEQRLLEFYRQADDRGKAFILSIAEREALG